MPLDTATGYCHVSNLQSWAEAMREHGRRPILTHLNADTTWLIQVPYPASASRPPQRTHFNVLLDPWLGGPQSDVAGWFSTQWHVVAPSVTSLRELNSFLSQLESSETLEESVGDKIEWFIDVVVISHEFTDHCHRATLEELPSCTLVIATDVAADLITSWDHFDTVLKTPGFENKHTWDSFKATCSMLPDWLAIGRIVTPGNSLYYHSAILIAFDLDEPDSLLNGAEAIVYSPHGVASENLLSLPASGLKTLALLHGLHDVSIWLTKQLNLGALNGLRAVDACQAKYWIATHDEVKKGGGLIAPLLQRIRYTLQEAIENQHKTQNTEIKLSEDSFRDLGPGEVMVLL